MKTAKLISALLLFGLIALGYFYPAFLFSPGGLIEKHSGIERCSACHDSFVKPGGVTCTASCHDAAYWKKKKGITTGHLENTGCLKCHTEHVGSAGRGTLQKPHRNLARGSNCLDCHRLGKSHDAVKINDCAKCHSMEAWKPARFDHALLEKGQACEKCHELPKRHADTRAGCDKCHQTKAWKPARFDHTLLEKTEKCKNCHPLVKNHFATVKDCARCHNATGWKPARFAHRFPMNHESRAPARCTVCHPDSPDRYDCFSGCHEHSVRKVRREHREEGIRDFTDCVKCHPTGREHEGGRHEREDGDEHDGFGWPGRREHGEHDDDD